MYPHGKTSETIIVYISCEKVYSVKPEIMTLSGTEPGSTANLLPDTGNR